MRYLLIDRIPNVAFSDIKKRALLNSMKGKCRAIYIPKGLGIKVGGNKIKEGGKYAVVEGADMKYIGEEEFRKNYVLVRVPTKEEIEIGCNNNGAKNSHMGKVGNLRAKSKSKKDNKRDKNKRANIKEMDSSGTWEAIARNTKGFKMQRGANDKFFSNGEVLKLIKSGQVRNLDSIKKNGKDTIVGKGIKIRDLDKV